VDDRYFRHSRDEEWSVQHVQPASDEFDAEGEYEFVADGEDEPLRM
jgi:hypothetical protein